MYQDWGGTEEMYVTVHDYNNLGSLCKQGLLGRAYLQQFWTIQTSG